MRLSRRPPARAASHRRPAFLIEIRIDDGSELEQRLAMEGLDPGEVILKYCWPRYAPPAASGIRAKGKSESLIAQFERLIVMHRQAPASFPMPVATVKSSGGEFAGYLLEYVEGVTLKSLIESGMLEEASLQLDRVEEMVGRMHAKNLPHGDLNGSNIIAADDGRTVLIDPVANPSSGTKLQDELCIAAMRRQIEDLSPRARSGGTGPPPRWSTAAPPAGRLGPRMPNAGEGRPPD